MKRKDESNNLSERVPEELVEEILKLRKENEKLKEELGKPALFWTNFHKLGKFGIKSFLGPSLVPAINRFWDSTDDYLNSGDTDKKFPKTELRNLIAQLTNRFFAKMGVIFIVGVIVSLGPIILLFQQNRLISNQTVLFEQQSSLLEEQTIAAKLEQHQKLQTKIAEENDLEKKLLELTDVFQNTQNIEVEVAIKEDSTLTVNYSGFYFNTCSLEISDKCEQQKLLPTLKEIRESDGGSTLINSKNNRLRILFSYLQRIDSKLESFLSLPNELDLENLKKGGHTETFKNLIEKSALTSSFSPSKMDSLIKDLSNFKILTGNAFFLLNKFDDHYLYMVENFEQVGHNTDIGLMDIESTIGGIALGSINENYTISMFEKDISFLSQRMLSVVIELKNKLGETKEIDMKLLEIIDPSQTKNKN